MQGMINLDKPAGLSSARCVDRVKRLLPRGVKVGHAGTLDPFATGVLVLLIGSSTRLAEKMMGLPKQYDATVRLGATTPTLDPESPELPDANARPLEPQAIDLALKGFRGIIQQVPPAYSAVKVRGMRSYDLARAGRPPLLAARPVRIDRIEVLDYAWPRLRLLIDCGRGFYVRSLARDLADALGTSGYLLELRRTRVGPCRAEEAVLLDSLDARSVMQAIRPVPDRL